MFKVKYLFEMTTLERQIPSPWKDNQFTSKEDYTQLIW